MIFVFCGTRICQASQRCAKVQCVLITPSCIYLWCKFPPRGRVFKIHDFFRHGFVKFFDIDKGHDQWVTPLGVR